MRACARDARSDVVSRHVFVTPAAAPAAPAPAPAAESRACVFLEFLKIIVFFTLTEKFATVKMRVWRFFLYFSLF